MRRVLSKLEILVRWTLGSVFVAAALPKLASPQEFSAIIDAYGILPDPLLLPAAILIPVFEMIFGVGFVLKKLWGAVGILAMLLFFICILSYAIIQGFDIDCGCFGPEDAEHQAFNGLRLALARDLSMVVFLTFNMAYRAHCIPNPPKCTFSRKYDNYSNILNKKGDFQP